MIVSVDLVRLLVFLRKSNRKKFVSNKNNKNNDIYGDLYVKGVQRFLWHSSGAKA